MTKHFIERRDGELRRSVRIVTDKFTCRQRHLQVVNKIMKTVHAQSANWGAGLEYFGRLNFAGISGGLVLNVQGFEDRKMYFCIGAGH